MDSDQAVRWGIVQPGRWARILALQLIVLLPSASPASAGPLTLQEAAKLAVEHNSPEAAEFVDRLPDLPTCFKPFKSFGLVPATPAFSDPAADNWVTGLLTSPMLPSSSADDVAPEGPQEAAPGRKGYTQNDIVFCTVNVYIQLVIVAAQLRTLEKQEFAADRLLRIEKRRVLEKVDEKAALTRAKLQLARARLWGAGLRSSDRHLRKSLARLTGITEDNVQLSVESVPSYPKAAMTSPASTEMIRQSLLIRDVAQLQYALARDNRQKLQVRMARGSLGLGDLVSGYLEEQERLNLLLAAESDAFSALVQSLFLTSQLNEWLAHPATDVKQTAGEQDVTGLSLMTPARMSDSEELRKAPIKSVLITPGISKMKAGDSRQLSVTVIYDDGSSKDLTQDATWWCSSDSVAILSTTGLLTGIREGKVTVSAAIEGTTQSRDISIENDDWTPFNP